MAISICSIGGLAGSVLSAVLSADVCHVRHDIDEHDTSPPAILPCCAAYLRRCFTYEAIEDGRLFRHYSSLTPCLRAHAIAAGVRVFGRRVAEFKEIESQKMRNHGVLFACHFDWLLRNIRFGIAIPRLHLLSV